MVEHRLARGGPYTRTRLPVEVKAEQGAQVYVRHIAGEPIRDVAAALGMSTTTAWRRHWFYVDAVAWPHLRDLPRSHVPPQRSSRACPAGEPPTLDRPAGGRRIRHPLPCIRCSARRSTDGRPCRRWAIRGGSVCPSHGGAAPAVRRAAAERVRIAVEADKLARARLRHPELRVADIRALVLAKPRPWHPTPRRRPA